MVFDPTKPVIVQSDRTILVEVDSPHYEDARDAIGRFAELVKSPEHIHTYRLTPLSLWNAAASGLGAEPILESLRSLSKYDVPGNIASEIIDYIARYGKVTLEKQGGDLILRAADRILMAEIWHRRELRPYLLEPIDDVTAKVAPGRRGHIKQSLLKAGYPVRDLAGYVRGALLELKLRDTTLSGQRFGLRDYQENSVKAFLGAGTLEGGSGVIVLPCGAGKTIVGFGAMDALQCATLILTTNIVASRQWKNELLDKTTLTADQVGEYSGEVKNIQSVTIATYQILTYHNKKTDTYPHFDLFNKKDWGLIIYDEVHLLPAPVFRITAEIQATRRLGLTATLVREDGHEDDVFSLIGPKRYDVPWKQMETQGWIATAQCYEIRVPIEDTIRMDYATAHIRRKYRVAAENPRKIDIVKKLIDRHQGDSILVIGQYLKQLRWIARRFKAPLILGETPTAEREELYGKFRTGEIKLLIVSKVANFAIDLPDANVAIQVSGTFGSRQEEAQRLGRILRPKKDGSPAHFYSIVTRGTRDQECSSNRQLFLTEQGYRYVITSDEAMDEDLDIMHAEMGMTGRSTS